MRRRARVKSIAVALLSVIIAGGCTISSTPSEESDGTVNLTFWEYYDGAQDAWLRGQVKAFEQDHPKINIDLIEVVGEQQDQKLLASAATGKTPDLFINNIVVDYPTLVGGEVMYDLTDFWNDYSSSEQFPSAAVWETDGRVYNLLPYTNLLGMYANTDILRQVGIDEVPQTLPELEEALATIEQDGRYKGLALSGAPDVEGAWLFAPQLLGLGVDYCSWGEQQQQVGAAFDRVDAWADAGYIPQAAATWDQNAAWQQFMTGKYAFAFNGNWQLGNVQDANFGYQTAQFPSPEGGQSQVYPGGEGYAIGSRSEHPDLAWQFLTETVLSEQGQQSVFTEAGSIPTRSDVARSDAVESNEYAKPFLAAAQNSASWPNNTNTADMQNSLGQAISSVISGERSGAVAADRATADIAAARADGGGTC